MATTLPRMNGGAITAHSDEPRYRGLVVCGLVMIVAFFGAVGGWSMYARLDSAVIAQGVVAVDSRRKTVQHKEGGILRDLLVKEGQAVHEGQPLARLDTTQAEALLSQLDAQQVALAARLSRLKAEQTDLRTLVFPTELVSRQTEPLVGEASAAQRHLFEARWRAFDSASAIVDRRILELRASIATAEGQLQAVGKRLKLVEEEEANVSHLLSLGYERRPRLLELQRAVEDSRGRQGELHGAIAQFRQAIATAEMERTNLKDTRQSEIAKEIEDARAQEADVADRIRAARDIRDRLDILSPQDGIVVGVRTVTPGGVFGPGQSLMDIVPVDDELIIEAKVRPGDIETVHVGMPAQVKLTAYKSTSSPSIDGSVVYVSADQIVDERTGTDYFQARVRLSRDSLAHWKEVTPQPGMPAEVMMVAGERRAIDYLLSPFQTRMRRAFREG